jgi:Tfp pilus assembly protein PilE
MLRCLVLVLLLIACMASLNCQSYTSGLVQSSGRADEAVLFATMRSIGRAQAAYNLSNSGDYGTFEQLAGGGHLDSRFNTSKPKIYGYILTMSANSGPGSAGESSYACNADPDPSVKRAGRHFYLDSASPLIHVNATQPASAKDETINP